MNTGFKVTSNETETQPKEQPEEVVEQITKPITRKTLLESGAHYGHKPEQWNPKMAPYIYGRRDDTYIIDLEYTLQLWRKAKERVYDHVSNGGTILFVGRRKKAQPLVIEEATRAGAFYMAGKWPGGTLTNFNTMRASVKRMVELEKFIENAVTKNKVNISKKELLFSQKELTKLQLKFNGIREMKKTPGMIFTTHSVLDSIAIAEAKTLQIPIVGLVDTDSNPDPFDYIIPTNDDATLSLKLFISNMAETVLEARSAYELKMQKQALENEQSAEKFIEAELE